ncbi:hypothetical protein BQ8482_340204 [Mesorhizobium delmotii]|uniref:Uncharacterized protein n=1 Tax=Mesorhizobium delmotii TaxID=1631247 RepID=A0A2P9AQ87_9HYPH|nr:hypothetical protein BQ8482_340204 [Mesorhizobium delmotii]
MAKSSDVETRLKGLESSIETYAKAKRELSGVRGLESRLSSEIAALGYESGAIIEYTIRGVPMTEGEVQPMLCVCACACLTAA